MTEEKTSENVSESKPYISSAYGEYRKTVCYKPKMHTMESMQENVKKAMKERKTISLRKTGEAPSYMRQNVWARKNQGSRFTPPVKFFKTPLRPTEPKEESKPIEQPKEEVEKKPYWDGVGWEEWAFQIYDNYPEMRKYLPEWFIEALEKNNQKQ